MVGNILRFNNIYNRIVIASETNDQKQIWFLAGRLFYYILYFKPIEAGSLNSSRNVFRLVNKLSDL